MSDGKGTTKKPKRKAVAKPPVKAVPQEDPHYTIRQWHERDMFQCSRCPWSTLDEDEMTRHVAKHLSSAQPSVIRTDTGFVTPSGNRIVREEIVEETKEVDDGTHDTHTG